MAVERTGRGAGDISPTTILGPVQSHRSLPLLPQCPMHFGHKGSEPVLLPDHMDGDVVQTRNIRTSTHTPLPHYIPLSGLTTSHHSGPLPQSAYMLIEYVILRRSNTELLILLYYYDRIIVNILYYNNEIISITILQPSAEPLTLTMSVGASHPLADHSEGQHCAANSAPLPTPNVYGEMNNE